MLDHQAGDQDSTFMASCAAIVGPLARRVERMRAQVGPADSQTSDRTGRTLRTSGHRRRGPPAHGAAEVRRVAQVRLAVPVAPGDLRRDDRARRAGSTLTAFRAVHQHRRKVRGHHAVDASRGAPHEGAASDEWYAAPQGTARKYTQHAERPRRPPTRRRRAAWTPRFE